MIVSKRKRKKGKRNSRIRNICGTHPATAKRMQIRTTNTTMRDLDIDIRLLPFLGRKFLPFHISLTGTRIQTHPSFELIFRLRHDVGEVRDLCNVSFCDFLREYSLPPKSFHPGGPLAHLYGAIDRPHSRDCGTLSPTRC